MTRLRDFQEKKESKLVNMKQKLAKDEFKDCTFQPLTNSQAKWTGARAATHMQVDDMQDEL